MRDGETRWKSARHKIEWGQDACWTYDLGNIQDLFARSFVNNGGHFSAEVGRDRNFDESVFQHDEGVFLKSWPVGGFAVTDVRIDSVGIHSGGDGSTFC